MRQILKDVEQAELRESLRRCSPATLEAAVRFRETGDAAAVPAVVYGIIARYQPAASPVKLAGADENLRLVEDLGLDSLTLLEIVMNIEEALKLRIENEELRSIRTLGQLNDFLQHKITGLGGAKRGRRLTRDELTLVLPQQPPFLFLDGAELNEDSVTGYYAVKGDEFFLEGHFRNDPVFPASIVFEAMGQAACLWLLEQGGSRLEKKVEAGQLYFASLEGAHFYRKVRPGENLKFELKLLKLRDPLAVFSGAVTDGGGKVAQIERLTLAFGESLKAETNGSENGAEISRNNIIQPVLPASRILQNGHH